MYMFRVALRSFPSDGHPSVLGGQESPALGQSLQDLAVTGAFSHLPFWSSLGSEGTCT